MVISWVTVKMHRFHDVLVFIYPVGYNPVSRNKQTQRNKKKTIFNKVAHGGNIGTPCRVDGATFLWLGPWKPRVEKLRFGNIGRFLVGTISRPLKTHLAIRAAKDVMSSWVWLASRAGGRSITETKTHQHGNLKFWGSSSHWIFWGYE